MTSRSLRLFRFPRFALCTLAGLAALTGCASFKGFEPATPEGFSGATVNVADRLEPIGNDLVQVFELTRFDGRRLLSSSVATLNANQGRGFSVKPVALTNEVPPGPAQVQLQVVTQYAAPFLAMTHPTCRVQGEVAFTPELGQAYRVTGRVAAEACEVWIENLATHQPVTAKVSGKGTGAGR
ncbi:hypothetical protein [Roseateles sp. BYS87W]|uniref:Lipoprotein n=1 Tax=Pelomonas baiyunensis TaxID=3299026 RepID=A0ABW7GYX2_9BURK